ncbi:MAG: Dethiobiotin synthetase [Candidatus Parcubacteria bacterium]|nr:Dethiobiotin synthetase [Leptolyngbyaceae cyanobacterium LF-bin-113]
MDYETARRLLIDQSSENLGTDSFVVRLRQGQPPIPGQVTSILLSLKVLFEALKGETTLDRDLSYALYLIASEGRRLFEAGLKQNSDCPPLLDEDLDRIAAAVRSIFSGVWQ